MAGAAAKRQFRPPKTRLSPAWNIHCPSTPLKTRPIRSSDIAVSQAVTEVSCDVQFLMKGAYESRGTAEFDPRGYSALSGPRKACFRSAAIH